MLGSFAPKCPIEKLFFSPKSDLTAEELGGISMPDKIKELLGLNNIQNVQLYMPGSPKSVITLLYNMMNQNIRPLHRRQHE